MENWQMDFARTIERHRREGLGWRYDGVADWSTDAIFKQLNELGIDTDAERFHAQATAAESIRVLRDDWDRQLPERTIDTFWPDFPLMAAPELWKRLAADVICPDLLELRLYETLKAEDDGEHQADV